jgi:hypothetical protein
LRIQDVMGLAPAVAAYGLLAFAFSFIGFVAQQPTVHFHEYSLPEAFVEVGGHFFFGAVAAAPFWRLDVSLVSGAFAVVIDADHLLGALNLSVSSRPDHSVAFVLAGTLILWLAAGRMKSLRIGGNRYVLPALVPVSVLSHVSYDILASYTIFAGRGFSFPIYIPLDYSLIPFPVWAWVPFEAAGLLLAFAIARRVKASYAGGVPVSKVEKDIRQT